MTEKEAARLIERMVDLAARRNEPVTRKASAWLADYEMLVAHGASIALAVMLAKAKEDS
jgi:hypothetical protein